MKRAARWASMLFAAAALPAAWLGCSNIAHAQSVAQAGSTGVEVQTRGPVHEAFAEPVVFNAAAGMVVPVQPPAPVHEIAPSVKPAGAHVVWLPGYWGWDDDRQDFLWISGVWRVPPPNSRWIPGYWSKAKEGFLWSPGFWVASGTAQIKYLPPPPKSQETGPTRPAPSANHFYIPGHWRPRGEQYVWQAGYWSQAKPGWVWTPACFLLTPAGAVYVAGRWDYPLAQRGLLFAPEAMDAAAAARPGFRFTPRYVVNTRALTDHLFVRADYRHYYFGDYYDARYANAGFLPWFAFQGSGSGYVPDYAYARWLYGRDQPDWDARMRAGYQARLDGAEDRPPKDWSALQAQAAARGAGKAGPIVMSLNDLLRSQASPLSLVHVNKNALARAAGLSEHVKFLAAQRSKLETGAGGKLDLGRAEEAPLTIDLPQLPGALSGTFGIGAAVTDNVEESLPGVGGRVVPGLGGRSAPGLEGRVVPGVEQVSPGGGDSLPGGGRPLGNN